MGKCNECNPCEETKCLGCSHYHTTECITLEDQFGTQPIGTNLTTTLAYIWTLLQSGTGVAGDDGVGVQGVTINGSGNLIITLTDGTIIDAGTVVGTDGADGQNIDNIAFTSSSLGGVASQQGATDTYTIWGDSGQTINLGTFTIYNAIDGVDATESTSTKFYFGSNYEYPNDATVGTPLLDYASVVVYNTTTIIPPTKTVFFNIDTKELWTFNGTTWDNTTSIGNHLLRTEFDLVVGDTLPTNETLIHAYSLPTNIEIGERIKARYIGRIKYNTYLKWKIFDGVSEDDIGKITEGVEGQWNEDIETAFLELEINITRKDNGTYYTSAFGGLRLNPMGNNVVFSTNQGLYIPLINNLQVSADTTTPMTIRLYAFNSISSDNTINLQEISYEKIKY